ncbi:MAG: rRNA maturation RNase YbeY [Ignavibacteria bacterium]|nr:rRNA maturation RNase YbeY [Ignavibacteria bacterium]
MKINFYYKKVKNKEKFTGLDFKKKVKEVISNISTEENSEFSYLNIIFCNDEIIRDYNQKFLGHDYETDIITFHDVDENKLIEGELLISTETVNTNSRIYKATFNEELLRVIIHGVLHLCGYKDRTKLQKVKIRKRENYYLKLK